MHDSRNTFLALKWGSSAKRGSWFCLTRTFGAIIALSGLPQTEEDCVTYISLKTICLSDAQRSVSAGNICIYSESWRVGFRRKVLSGGLQFLIWDYSLMSGFDYDIKDSMKYDSYQHQDDRVIQGKQMSSILSRYQHFSSSIEHVF